MTTVSELAIRIDPSWTAERVAELRAEIHKGLRRAKEERNALDGTDFGARLHLLNKLCRPYQEKEKEKREL